MRRVGRTSMSLLLLVLGFLLAAAGAAAMGFGIPINELALGSTLITAGTTALVGGLLLVGLSAAVAELSGIVKNLKAGPVVRPARATAEPASRCHRGRRAASRARASAVGTDYGGASDSA